MKKKLIASITCLCMLLVMLMSSTLAWFTDTTDVAHNTMVVGNVSIVQHEKDRNGNDFVPPQTIGPAVPEVLNQPLATTSTSINGTLYDLFKTSQGVVDKIVTVENDGNAAAYVRTIFAVEMKKAGDNWFPTVGSEVILNDNQVTVNGYTQKIEFPTDANSVTMPVMIYKMQDGTYVDVVTGADVANIAAAYMIGVYTYYQPLAAGATSAPSLLQFYLTGLADNNFIAQVGGVFEISVLSQAVQLSGFEQHGAEASLNYVFGEVNAANAAAWFGTGIAEMPATVPSAPRTLDFSVYDPFNSGISGTELTDVNMTVYTFDANDYQGAYPVEQYADWTCDFFVSTNAPVEDGIILAGSYDPFGWLGFWVPANNQPYEPTGLLGAVTNGGASNWSYYDICTGVKVFECGIINTKQTNSNVQATVELRMTSPDGTQTISVRSITVTLGYTDITNN